MTTDYKLQLRLCEEHAGSMSRDFDASLAIVQAERDALQYDLAKAREGEEKWRAFQTVDSAPLIKELAEAREEIARLKEQGRIMDEAYGATSNQAKTLRAELTAMKEYRNKYAKMLYAIRDRVGCGHVDEALPTVSLLCARLDDRAAALASANARADKAEGERDAALVFATRRKQERDAANARAENPELLNVRAIVDERDDLRRKLAEAEEKHSASVDQRLEDARSYGKQIEALESLEAERDSALAALEKCKAGSQVVVAQYTKVIAQLETRNAESLAALEATRELVRSLQYFASVGISRGPAIHEWAETMAATDKFVGVLDTEPLP